MEKLRKLNKIIENQAHLNQKITNENLLTVYQKITGHGLDCIMTTVLKMPEIKNIQPQDTCVNDF